MKVEQGSGYRRVNSGMVPEGTKGSESESGWANRGDTVLGERKDPNSTWGSSMNTFQGPGR